MYCIYRFNYVWMPVFSHIIPFYQLWKMDLTIATFNVNSMSEQAKGIAVISFLETVKADVILVQETHSRPHQEKAWQKEWRRGQALFHSNTENENAASIAFLGNWSRVYSEEMNSDLQGRGDTSNQTFAFRTPEPSCKHICAGRNW